MAATTQPVRLWNKNYLLLWQGQFISRLGDQAFNIALVLWIAQTTGSATLMGLSVMALSIPALILAPIGGAVADRYSRRTIVIACDLIRGIAVLSLVAVLFFAPQATGVALVWLFIVSLCLTILSAFFGPAISASIPDLVPKERVAGANSMGQLSAQISVFIGQGIGGTLFRVLGAPVMFLIDGLSFLFAAASTSLVTIPQRIPERSGGWQRRFAEFKKDLVEGLRYVWTSTGLKGLVLISAVYSFFAAPLLVLLPFYVNDYLKVPADWYGFLLAALAVGELIGYLVVGVTALSGRARGRIILVMLFLDAIAYGLLALTQNPLLALAIGLLRGVIGGFVTVNITTLVQLTTPGLIRGRVFGLLGTISGSIMPIAAGLSGVVADLTGRNIPLIYLTCSAGLMLLAVMVTFNREVRGFLAYEPKAAVAQESKP
jgi:MFS family permease